MIKYYKKQLRELGVQSGGRGEPLSFLTTPRKEDVSRCISLFSKATSDRMRGPSLKLKQRRFRLDIWKKFLHGKDYLALEWGHQEGVIIPIGIQEINGCGT